MPHYRFGNSQRNKWFPSNGDAFFSPSDAAAWEDARTIVSKVWNNGLNKDNEIDLLCLERREYFPPVRLLDGVEMNVWDKSPETRVWVRVAVGFYSTPWPDPLPKEEEVIDLDYVARKKVVGQVKLSHPENQPTQVEGASEVDIDVDEFFGSDEEAPVEPLPPPSEAWQVFDKEINGHRVLAWEGPLENDFTLSARGMLIRYNSYSGRDYDAVSVNEEPCTSLHPDYDAILERDLGMNFNLLTETIRTEVILQRKLQRAQETAVEIRDNLHFADKLLGMFGVKVSND